jgi:hypothetical protein
MDVFESVIATIVEREGFRVRTSFKVKLTKEEKREISRPSSPRWEIDVLAYRPGDNLLWAVECKSYLDSRGVTRHGFSPGRSRLKLFNDATLREVVFRRLTAQLEEEKSIRPGAKVQLCLVAGKIVKSDMEWLQSHFDANGWLLYSPSWISERLHLLAQGGYDNAVAAVTAKMLLRTQG